MGATTSSLSLEAPMASAGGQGSGAGQAASLTTPQQQQQQQQPNAQLQNVTRTSGGTASDCVAASSQLWGTRLPALDTALSSKHFSSASNVQAAGGSAAARVSAPPPPTEAFALTSSQVQSRGRQLALRGFRVRMGLHTGVYQPVTINPTDGRARLPQSVLTAAKATLSDTRRMEGRSSSRKPPSAH